MNVFGFLECFSEQGITLNEGKFKFTVSEVSFLGTKISQGGKKCYILFAEAS